MFEEFIQDKWQVTHKLNLDYGFRITTTIPYSRCGAMRITSILPHTTPSAAPQINPTTGNVTLGTGNPYNGIVIPGISKFPSSALKAIESLPPIRQIMPAPANPARACLHRNSRNATLPQPISFSHVSASLISYFQIPWSAWGAGSS